MQYDFDTPIDRTHTWSIKHDFKKENGKADDILPLWVADMDFRSPDSVVEALKKAVDHGIFGYSRADESYFDAVAAWYQKRHHLTLQPEWMTCTPGIVFALSIAVRAFTQEGDAVLIQPPVYHPFARQTRFNNRVVVNNPLSQRADGSFGIDFDDLDRKLAGAKVFLMSNPHNPSGRVYTAEELTRIGELCVKHDVVILSDEIHGDLVYKPHKHIHIAALDEAFARRTVTFTAPSKTFNLAGLSTSVAITPDAALRRRLQQEFNKLHADQGNIFGTVALEAAYTHGDEWLERLLEYLEGNIRYVTDFLHRKMPSVKCVPPEGTYLMWLDFRAWPMTHEEIYRFMVERAGIGVNEGSMFGEEGRGWMRMNIATQRSVVERAMNQLYEAARAAGLCE